MAPGGAKGDALEQVILVDDDGRTIGVADKLDAHRVCRRHRAFSVFVVSGDGRLLLQRRHPAKYHTGGLWTNACDGHPRPGEGTVVAARRRLREELGVDCELRELYAFTYEAELGDGMIECELDHVLLGTYDGEVVPDPTEVVEWAWAPAASLRRRVAQSPEAYAIWFRLALPRVLEHLGVPSE